MAMGPSAGDAAVPAPAFSLVVATVGRVAELARLFESLAQPQGARFEVIVVDQNEPGTLDALVERYRDALDIAHLRSPRGLSRARNAGLAAVRGTMVAFPDDDCRYPPGTLARVQAALAATPGCDGITGRVPASRGERPPARFGRSAHVLDARSVYLGGMSSVIFLTAALCRRNGPFDEALGLGSGSAWIAAEETDYLARAVSRGARIRYEPTIAVEHPGWRGPISAAQAARGGGYARAFGYVMRRHGAPPLLLAHLVARALAGSACALLTGRAGLARYHLAVARGRVAGWHEGAGGPARHAARRAVQ